MMDFDEPYWLEDPSVVISPIKAFIKKGGDYDLDAMTKKLAQGREKAIANLLAKVPKDEKPWFEALIMLGGKTGSFSEEHDLFCELHCHAVQRRGLLGIGRRLAAAGTIDKPDDIFFLNPDEVERVLGAPEFHKLQYITKRRRARWEKIKFSQVPPVLTTRANIQEAVGMDLLPSADAIIIKIVVGELPRVRPELKADIYGVCGAPGVAEGPATSHHELRRTGSGPEGGHSGLSWDQSCLDACFRSGQGGGVGPGRNAQSHGHRGARVRAADPGQHLHGYRYDQDRAEDQSGCHGRHPLHSREMIGLAFQGCSLSSNQTVAVTSRGGGHGGTIL